MKCLSFNFRPPSENNSLPSEILKIEVQHGSDRHPVILKNINGQLTVLDLENELERITSVPVKDQRLYFKSHELDLTPFKSLKDCGLVNNSFVKLVGEPSKMRYSNIFGRLNPSTKSDSTTSHQFFSNSSFNQNNQNTYSPNFQRFNTPSNGHTNYMNHGGMDINHNLVNNQHTNHPNANVQTHHNNINNVHPHAHPSSINHNLNAGQANGLNHNNPPVHLNTNTIHSSPIQLNNVTNNNAILHSNNTSHVHNAGLQLNTLKK